MSGTFENNKRIAKNTLMLYLRMLFTMAVSFYTSRVVLQMLGVSDFGIYNVVGGLVTMFTFVSGAMTTATQRFLSIEIGRGEGGDVRRMFSTAVMVHALLGVAIIVAGETAGVWFLNNYMNFPADRYTAANWVYQLSLATFVIDVMSVPYNAAIIAYERMKAFAYVSIVEAALKLGVVFLITLTTHDKLVVYAALLAALAVAIRLIYGWYCRRHFPACRCDLKWDRARARGMMSFLSWNLIGSLAGVGKEQGVNVLLNIDPHPRHSLSFNWMFYSGQPTTYPVGKAVIDGHFVPIYGKRNANRMENYHRLDVAYTFRSRPGNGKPYRWSLSAGLYNAYGRKNPWSVSFYQDAADPNRSYAVKIYLFSVVPFVTFNFNF